MAGRGEIRIEIPGFLQAMAQIAQALGRAVEKFYSTAQLVDALREQMALLDDERARAMAEEEARMLWGDPTAPEPAGIITRNQARDALGLPALDEDRQLTLAAMQPSEHINALYGVWEVHYPTADPSVAAREERRRRQADSEIGQQQAEIEVRQRLGMAVSMTQEDRDRIDRAFQDYLREQEKALAEHQAAQRKACELLTSCLDEGQKMTFEASGFFDVRGQDGKLYQIWDSSVMNVIEVGNNTRYCAQFIRRPDLGHIPIYDQMLAQKLCLETDIKRFLAVANKSQHPPEPPVEGHAGPRWIP